MCVMREKKFTFSGKAWFLLMGLGILLSFSAQAQDCGCDHTIELSTTHIDGSQMGVKAGDVICLKAGKRTNLYIKNIKGAANNYVTIKNCGGQVVLGGDVNNGILVQNSRYFRITGTGDSSYEYGIKIDRTKAGSQGVAVTEFSSDVEIDHLEISGAGFAGIMAKTDPKCDGSADRGKFTMYNVKIHNNYIHDVSGEGIYLGNSFYNGTKVYCDRTQYPHEIKGVRVYDNIVKNTGWDALQIGAATEDVEIYNNEIYNFGTANREAHRSAIQLGLGTTGKCYNNLIDKGTGAGITVQGIGNNLVYNNIIKATGEPAFNVNVRPTPLSTDVISNNFLGGVYFINNTVIDSNNKGAINEYVNDAKNNVFYNNLVVTNTSWNKLKTHTDWKLEKNIILNSTSDAKFKNSGANDFRLNEGSPAIEAGKDISSYGITKDWDFKERKVGTSPDAGISEFASVSSAGNTPPTVNAGSDNSILLPANSTSFTATASDKDGSIASYSWSKVDGPAATMNGTSSSKLELSNLTAGSYTFKVTVKDNNGATASDEVQLTVNAAKSSNVAPTVNAGSDKTIQLPSNSTSISGNASDSDGSISSYSWSKVSGPSATMNGTSTAKLELSSLTEGSYTFKLTVKDNADASASDEVNLTVKAAASDDDNNGGDTGSGTLTADAGDDQTVQLPTNSLTIKANATGDIANYTWSKIDGPYVMMNGGNTPTLSLSDLQEGTYNFRFRVKDGQSGSASDDVKVVVTAASGDNGDNNDDDNSDEGGDDNNNDGGDSENGNLLPLVKASNDKTLTLPINATLLTCAGKDEDGFIISYEWKKMSGPSAGTTIGSTANFNITGLTEGTYVFRVTATDNDKGEAYDEVTVKVVKDGSSDDDQDDAPENQAPTVNAGSDKSITLPTNSTSLSAQGRDGDGNIASYNWSKVSGPSASLSGNTSANLNLSNLLEGAYTFRVTVKDDKGASAYDDVKVTVNKAANDGGDSGSTTYEAIYRINAGGGNISDAPIQWDHDNKENPSKYLSSSSSNNSAGSSSWNKTNNTQAPNAIFGPIRFDFEWGGAMKYSFPVKNGTYEVRLYFAETPYAGGVSGAGQRVFDIKAEGQTKVSGLDIYKEAGMNALQKTVEISVTDGQLDLDFVRRIGNPQINGIEILPAKNPNTSSSANVNSGTTDTFGMDFQEQPEPEQNFTVYPNPVEDQLNIRFGKVLEGNATAQLVSLNGTVIVNEQLNTAQGNSEASINVGNLNIPAGIYLLRVQAAGSKEQVVKVYKK
jgi:hypothetical protein